MFYLVRQRFQSGAKMFNKLWRSQPKLRQLLYASLSIKVSKYYSLIGTKPKALQLFMQSAFVFTVMVTSCKVSLGFLPGKVFPQPVTVANSPANVSDVP